MSVINPYKTDPMFHREPEAEESFDLFVVFGRVAYGLIWAFFALLYMSLAVVLAVLYIPAVIIFYPLFWLYKKVKR